MCDRFVAFMSTPPAPSWADRYDWSPETLPYWPSPPSPTGRRDATTLLRRWPRIVQMHQRGYTWRRPRRPRPERAPALRRGPQVQRRDLCGLAPLVEGRRFILAGDWNTARHQGTERDSR